MGKIRRFADLEVWRKAHTLFVDIFNTSRGCENHAAIRALIAQITRSCGSIGANISEGHFGTSVKEYIRYLNIAKRSTAETENWLYKMRDVDIIPRDKCNDFVSRCVEIQKMLSGLMKSLEKYKEK